MHHGETQDEENLKKMRISGRSNHETNAEDEWKQVHTRKGILHY